MVHVLSVACYLYIFYIQVILGPQDRDVERTVPRFRRILTQGFRDWKPEERRKQIK